MNPITIEKLLLTVDRIASELLWTVNELNQQQVDLPHRRRAAEMLDVVISGLRHTQRELVNHKEEF